MTSRQIVFDGIKLVSVFRDFYPYSQEKYRDMWHIPGRTILSTDALVTLATRRGFAISLVEQDGIYVTTTRLN